MATRKTIDECLLMIRLDHSINVSDNEFKMRGKMLFDLFNKVTDKQFEAATHKILSSGTDLYGKFPTSAMFRENIFGKELTTEEVAQKEVSLIMTAIISYYGELESTNPTTLKTVDDMGGLKALKWTVDFDNDNRRKSEWVKKEAMEIWIVNARSDAIEDLSIESDNTIPMIESLADKLKG